MWYQIANVLSQKIWRALVYINCTDSHRSVDEGVTVENSRMNRLLFADEMVLHVCVFSIGLQQSRGGLAPEIQLQAP